MKALCVFSGGLDSMLAAALIRSEGVDALALFFETPFFQSERARKSAASMDLPIRVVDITERHIQVVKNPAHGYGENMNPCIDCHALMVRVAGEMMSAEDASFVVTGEVLGQRPMSQNKRSLEIVAQESGLGRLLVRPLSAKHLAITIPEERGWIRRERLMDIKGRSRKQQIQLAETLGITDYPMSAGGCLLTDEVFSRRLRDLISFGHELTHGALELLKVGRHFRVSPHAKLVVGRNREENQAIDHLVSDRDVLLKCLSVPGPTAAVLGRPSRETLELAAAISASYSDARETEVTLQLITSGGKKEELWTVSGDKRAFRHLMI
jgi:tRNA U34 2-thiouridine synthase MnmA/TrmU